MKKWLMMILCVTLLALTACGQGGSETAPAAGETATEQTANSVDEAEAEQTANPTDEAATEPADKAATEAVTKPADEKETGADEYATYPAEGTETETFQAAGMIDVSRLPAGTVLSEDFVAMYGEDTFFTVTEISDELFDRMNGRTFKEYSPVSREELRYIRCLHRDINGRIMIGEIVMNEQVAYEVCDIMHQLYTAWYPIEKMHLQDDYNADDELSMEDNNTSSFNVKYAELTETLDRHSYGMAIDINPLYNIYYVIDQDIVYPFTGRDYIDRNQEFPYKLVEEDLCCQLFLSYGYTWGGSWGWPDYMHFEK